jgi:hypothetical protein
MATVPSQQNGDMAHRAKPFLAANPNSCSPFSDTWRMRMADFEVSNHGTIYILTPLTAAARDWVAEFLPEDAQRWAGGVAIEHRYISGVVIGAQRDGLSMVRG